MTRLWDVLRGCSWLILLWWSALVQANVQEQVFYPGVSVAPDARSYQWGKGERILLFDSQARFQTDGSMLVEESIKVQSNGEQIKRGIFRTLPLVWNRQDGSTFRLEYHVKAVLRDGVPENYTLEQKHEQLKVLIGSAERVLQPGIYDYRIQYQVSNHFSRFPDWDELYWNVTGNGWSYPIDKVRFRLSLPEQEAFLTPEGKDARLRSIDVYTGQPGEKGSKARILAAGNIETMTPLDSGEGVTVAYTWPRSILASAPAPKENSLFGDRLSPTLKSAILWFPPFLILAYFLFWWAKYITPIRLTKPAVVPLYSVPDGMSPGYVRYLCQRTYDNVAFSSDVLDLVAKRAIALTKVIQKPRKTRSGTTPKREEQWLTRLPESESMTLTAEDKAFLNTLFPGKRKKLDITKTSMRSVSMQKARKEREAQYKKIHSTLFLSVAGAMKVGIALSLLVPVLYGLFFNLFMAITTIIGIPFLLFSATLCLQLLRYVRHFSQLRHSEKSKVTLFLVVVGFLFTLPFGLGMLRLLTSSQLPTDYQGALSTSLLLCLGFFCIVPRHTKKGLAGMSVAKGMTLYLRTAEERRYETLYPPDERVTHFERMLPYALALGVGETWANTFAQFLKHHHMVSDVFSSTQWDGPSQFNSACSSSSRTVSSSGSGSGGGGSSSGSGSSGGGSSGGGSGGGGGGGW
ncbi:membrane protein [Pectobacterium carotovorum subsp. carotovorum]|nr:membrane protein [Pectobacterium carotovorum subsp. carotovorum]GLW38201.1 membrane protein [Pectobacterium carotovorum subsp. carotovorum]